MAGFLNTERKLSEKIDIVFVLKIDAVSSLKYLFYFTGKTNVHWGACLKHSVCAPSRSSISEVRNVQSCTDNHFAGCHPGAPNVRKVGRTIELSLQVFIRDNEYAVLTAAEKVQFLGKLYILEAVGCEKAGSHYLFRSMEVLFSVFLLSQEALPFGLVQWKLMYELDPVPKKAVVYPTAVWSVT